MLIHEVYNAKRAAQFTLGLLKTRRLFIIRSADLFSNHVCMQHKHASSNVCSCEKLVTNYLSYASLKIVYVYYNRLRIHDVIANSLQSKDYQVKH